MGSNPTLGTMFTIYVLLSSVQPKTYVGYTSNLDERIRYHNNGKVMATKLLRPWRIIYTEKIDKITEAKHREKYWKSGAGRKNLKLILTGVKPKFKTERLPAP